jgi:hypothetical protein
MGDTGGNILSDDCCCFSVIVDGIVNVGVISCCCNNVNGDNGVWLSKLELELEYNVDDVDDVDNARVTNLIFGVISVVFGTMVLFVINFRR